MRTPRYDLVVEGRLWHRGDLVAGCVGIEDGRITAVKKILKGEARYDAGHRLVLPGATDLHVHFRDPGSPEKEDFASGTIAAAHGGITAVLDMPNTAPAPDRVARYTAKWEAVRAKAWVDYGLYAAFGEPAQVPVLAQIAAGFKAYLAPTTAAPELSPERLVPLLAAVPRHRLVTVHAEDPASFVLVDPLVNPAGWDRHRPIGSEVAAVRGLGAIAPRGFHLAHVTGVPVLDAVDSLRTGGLAVTTEATPHHLFLHTGLRLHSRGKVNPPLRDRTTANALWEAFTAGRIDVLASDHAPHTEKEKAQSFAAAPSGVPGVEFLLPLLLARVRRGDVPLARVLRAIMERPAELAGLPKGRLAPGYDADLAIVDPRQLRAIRQKDVRSHCGWSPYVRSPGLLPSRVYLRGSLLVDRGELVGSRKGTFLKGGWEPPPAPPPRKRLVGDVPRGTSPAEARRLLEKRHAKGLNAAQRQGPR